MPDPRDVLVSALIFVGTFVWIVGGSRFGPRAWGWLCERVARAAYARGYDVGHQRGWSDGYAKGWALGCLAGEARMKRQNGRVQLGLPAQSAPRVQRDNWPPHPPGAFRGFGGRLGRQLRDTHHPPAPPPGFNDSEGDEVL